MKFLIDLLEIIFCYEKKINMRKNSQTICDFKVFFIFLDDRTIM